LVGMPRTLPSRFPKQNRRPRVASAARWPNDVADPAQKSYQISALIATPSLQTVELLDDPERRLCADELPEADISQPRYNCQHRYIYDIGASKALAPTATFVSAAVANISDVQSAHRVL
jgi:hypothetical protein